MKKLIIVGDPQDYHVGAHFHRACQTNGIYSLIQDVRGAFSTSFIYQKISWYFFDKKPANLTQFSRSTAETIRKGGFTHLLATGICPITIQDLNYLRNTRVTTFNYLTDDPFNPVHYSKWFVSTLPYYNCIFTTRKANIKDLLNLGCRNVYYLPFGYDPAVHKPIFGATKEEESIDVLFAGGADSDRVPYIRALIKSNVNLALYGGYWDRIRDLRPYWKGHATLNTLCRVTRAAKIVLCLVRKANRDGHSMRSFEVPAMGGFPLLENTQEHREIFSGDCNYNWYFSTPEEMVYMTKELLNNSSERIAVRDCMQNKITGSKNSYFDRLNDMLIHLRNISLGESFC